MTKILVIEDSSDLREDIIEMLLLEQYEVVEAENGVMGVEVAQRELPDLIICDIMMPELDGYGVLEILRADAATAWIPFIFLTARTEHRSVRQGMTLGAEDYVTKPFTVPDLVTSIQTQLKKRANLREIADQHLEELRKNIVAALPHELRTPLSVIIGYSDMIITDEYGLTLEQVAEWAEHINHAGHRLHRLIENYLFYAKLQVMVNDDVLLRANEPLLELSEIIVHEASRIAAQAQREADLVVDVAECYDVHMAYRDASKVAFELIDNAFKFSAPGQKVRVSTRMIEGCYELSVTDEGRGMTSEQETKVGAFMQFERLLYEQQGMGLGLAIVHGLAKVYRSAFTLSGTGQQGTTALFRFKVG